VAGATLGYALGPSESRTKSAAVGAVAAAALASPSALSKTALTFSSPYLAALLRQTPRTLVAASKE
jgi:hypothetical protein